MNTIYLLNILKYLPIRFLFRPFYAGKGSILFMHKVVQHHKKDNRIDFSQANEIEISYLEKMIVHLKKKGYEFISLDELHYRLDNHTFSKKKFIAITFDDGYKDNYTLAYPLLKKHKVPFTIYITNCFPNHTAKLWWYMLEDVVLENEEIKIYLKGKSKIFRVSDYKTMEAVFLELREILISSSPSQQKDILSQLEKNYNKSLDDYVKKESLSWKDIESLAEDELVTIGAHTLNHYSLKTLEEEEIINEVLNSKSEIESHIKRKVEHFAYPFGTKNEIGKRESMLLNKTKSFNTATTTRMSNIFEAHKSHKTMLPRIQILGDRQDLSILDMYLCGMLPALKNKFKRIVSL